jgi:CHAD domain-containing protein
MTKGFTQPPAVEVKNALRRQIGESAFALEGGELSDEAIHAARKKLKSARAKLRLLRAAVGRETYARENAALRDAARPLGAVRDSKVMLDAVDRLLERKGTRSRRVLLTALRARLQQAHAVARAEFGTGRQAAVSAAALLRAAQRIGRWNVSRHGNTALARGIERIYRSARKALRAVETERSAESLHELRKQVKYLREALTPFESAGARGTHKILKHADALADALGEDHDLFVLQQNIAAAGASMPEHRTSFAQEIESRRDKLEKPAVKRSRRLLSRKPASFVRRFAL